MAVKPVHLSAHAWEIAKEIADRFNAYAGKKPVPSFSSSKSPVSVAVTNSARVKAYRHYAKILATRELHVSRSAAYQKDKLVGKRLFKWVQRYHPYVEEKNGKYVMRTEVNGVPVIPPGMTGAQLQQFIDHKALAIQQKTATTLIFISLSMPKHILKRMFADAWDNKKLRTHSVFVFRGWPAKPDGLQILVSKIIRMFPSPKDQPTVEVNPTLFTGHRVTRVPVVLHEDPYTKKWGAIVGDGYGLDAAIQRINQGKGSDHKVFGRTWKIAEPNLIHLILRRARAYNWKAEEARARQRNLVAMSHQLAVHLPESRHPLNYLWDPAVVAGHNVVLPDGQEIAYRGERINPLRYYPQELSQAYVLFNPKVRWQVQDVEGWLSVYRNLLLMATSLPSSPATLSRLDRKLNHFVFASSPLLAYRLGIRAVPALVTIDRYRLHIHVPAIPRLAPPKHDLRSQS